MTGIQYDQLSEEWQRIYFEWLPSIRRRRSDLDHADPMIAARERELDEEEAEANRKLSAVEKQKDRCPPRTHWE